jgi:hypothetical protein
MAPTWWSLRAFHGSLSSPCCETRNLLKARLEVGWAGASPPCPALPITLLDNQPLSITTHEHQEGRVRTDTPWVQCIDRCINVDPIWGHRGELDLSEIPHGL